MSEEGTRAFERLGRTTVAALLVFVFTLLVFMFSRIHQVTDSEYSLLLSQSLIAHRSFTLDEYQLPRHEPQWHGYYFANGPVYQLEVAGGHLYYHLPPGSSVLSVPFVAALNVLGMSAANPDGTYNHRDEVKMEAALAALLMAGLASLFFYTARVVLPVGWSVCAALGGALGTQVYSTASRALWSDTWGLLLLGFVVLLLVRAEAGVARLSPVLLASLLSWMYFVRPTYAVHIMAVSVYLFLVYRRLFLRYALAGAAWLALFVCYSWSHFGKLLPSYYGANRLALGSFWEALAGNLISPARGLLVYVPLLFFVAYLLMRYRRRLPVRRLVWLSLAIIVGQLLVASSFPHWWGGHSYGPRFMTGAVPWIVLLGIQGLGGMLLHREAQGGASHAGRRVELAAGFLVLLLSLFINTVGATSHAAWLWNMRPQGIDEHPERLWDWRQPQFLAGFLPLPQPRDFPQLLTTARVELATPEAEKYLWYGWSGAEAGGRWSDNRAAIVFALAAGRTSRLRLQLSPFLVPGRLDAQTLKITLNDRELQTLRLQEPEAKVYTILLPAELLRERNVLSLELPDGRSPQELGAGEDARRRGILLQWIELEPEGAGQQP